MTGRPLVPVPRGLLLTLTAATAGRSMLAAGCTWLVALAAVLGVAAPLALDPHPAPAGDWWLGGLLHLLCGAVGSGLALLFSALRLSRGAQAVLVVAVSVLSGRLRWLPPDGPVLAGWGVGAAPSPGLAAWSLTGPLLVAGVLVAAAAAVRRRRI